MRSEVNAIAGRLSLRPPQRRSLEILDRITEIVPPRKYTDSDAALAAIASEFPTVKAFERDFPSLCFALATGVGKTRLMGAFISYLHLAHGLDNFFVLAPSLTIYNKLIADFTPNTPKYVFKGIAAFATHPPEIITGNNYEARAGTLFDELVRCKINIFNISKINSEVRGGRSPRIKRLSEYIGESYFEYLAGLSDLVMLMDESHRYRASAGVRAINELNPVLGLELTATPFVETPRGAVPFQNVIYDYPLGQAMADGFVKEPAVVTRQNFNAAGMSAEAIERMKLEDGIRLHESVKVELETYGRETGITIVKPFLLVIARDTIHATQLVELIGSEAFFDGRYAGKVIQVDSSRTGAQEEEMVERLLRVEDAAEPTEIVVHVNMLKEGWDVTNLYTIVPLRAANARTLIEQSIGRGLRLPYGKRTGVSAVDRLNIVAHDRFQEIVNEANRPESLIHLQQVILTDETLRQMTTVVSPSNLAVQLGTAQRTPTSPGGTDSTPTAPSTFSSPEAQRVAQIAYKVISELETKPGQVPSLQYLESPAIQNIVRERVEAEYRPAQTTLDGFTERPDIAAIVAQTTDLVILQTIDIPRVLVVPKGVVRSGFKPFMLDLSSVRFPPVSATLLAQHLRTQKQELLQLGVGNNVEERLEDYLVRGLVDFDDVAYDTQSELLYDLAGQVVEHLRSYLAEDDVRGVLSVHEKQLAQLVHAQMQAHYWEDVVEYDVVVTRGFTTLRESAYSAPAGESPLDFSQSPADKSNMARYLFTGFSRCLYALQKFQSEQERILATILDRAAMKWFKPARGQFQLYYRWDGEHHEYQPDFVAETDDAIYMLEPKAANQITDGEVLAKKDAAVLWCQRASAHTTAHGGKPWVYALIPHNAIAMNMTLEGLVRQFGDG